MTRTLATEHQEVRLSLPTDRRMINPTIEMLLAFGERAGVLADREDRARTGVALEEALVNAIVHGNLEVSSKLRDLNDDSFEKLIALRIHKSPYKDRRIDVIAVYTATEAIFTIRDDGYGFDTSSVPNPLSEGFNKRPHGRGLLLMRSFMDVIKFNEKGNRVTMTKRRKVEEPVDAEESTVPSDAGVEAAVTC